MKMHPARVLRTALAIVLVCAVSASAQNASRDMWEAYRQGVKLFKAGQFKDAVPLFEKAYKLDPVSSKAKRAEGNFTEEYFPAAYLVVSYFRLGNFAQARLYVSAAGNEVGGNLAKDLAAAQQQINEFEAHVQRADSLAGKQDDDARTELEAAKKLNAAEFARRNLQSKLDDLANRAQTAAASAATARAEGARRDDAAKAEVAKAEATRQQARTLADQGRDLLGKSKLDQARQQFDAALKIDPSLKDASDGIAEIRRRDADYDQQKKKGDQAFGANDLNGALSAYTAARTTNPDRFARDNLTARMNGIEAKAGQAKLNETRWADAQRAFGAGQYRDALTTLDQLLKGQPGNRDAQALHVKAESRAIYEDGRAAVAAEHYPEAERKYQEALKKDPSNQDAKAAFDKSLQFAKLALEARNLIKDGKAAEAQKPLLEARGLDETRFNAERLSFLLKEAGAAAPASGGTTPTATPDSGATGAGASGSGLRGLVERGLLTLINGDFQGSVTSLQQAIGSGGARDNHLLAISHAYLGVAHASLSLAATDPKKADSERQVAMESFRQAFTLQRDLRLSNQISPKIREWFDQARK
jgi:tetratricopeptide (TPR) repeat protein